MKTQMQQVLNLLQEGGWKTPAQIAKTLGIPKNSVTSRIRDLRLEKNGKHKIEIRSTWEPNVYEYKLIVEKPKATTARWTHTTGGALRVLGGYGMYDTSGGAVSISGGYGGATGAGGSVTISAGAAGTGSGTIFSTGGVQRMQITNGGYVILNSGTPYSEYFSY